MSKKRKKKSLPSAVAVVVLLIIISSFFAKNDEKPTKPDTGKATFYEYTQNTQKDTAEKETTEKTVKVTQKVTSVSTGSKKYKISLKDIPKFKNKPYVVINGNEPYFKKSEITKKDFEYYSPLDSLGRCSAATASVGKKLMPTEKRGEIGSVKPSGWQTVKYDCVDGKYLYNRCHLIGYQLSGENANRQNLITGTRYMNVEGMLPFENMVADYVKETNNHVMYRVTPVFSGNELVARGVQMEAFSVEDNGDGVCFNVFCYNAQPGVTIDYSTGTSEKS